MTKKIDAVTVYFGGSVAESWTDSGMTPHYSDRLPVIARLCDGVWRAEEPEHEAGGDVKAMFLKATQIRELVLKLNSGKNIYSLALAYFEAAADAALAFASCKESPALLPETFRRVLKGTNDVLILPELLRLFLDDGHLSWESAMGILADCFTLAPDGETLRVPVSAISGLQPRVAKLITAINEKFCSLLWNTFPGDWLRISENAIVKENEVDMTLLGAVVCGRIICKKEVRAEKLRVIYSLMPAKFNKI